MGPHTGVFRAQQEPASGDHRRGSMSLHFDGPRGTSAFPPVSQRPLEVRWSLVLMVQFQAGCQGGCKKGTVW